MTVKELISQLQQFDENLPVWIDLVDEHKTIYSVEDVCLHDIEDEYSPLYGTQEVRLHIKK